MPRRINIRQRRFVLAANNRRGGAGQAGDFALAAANNTDRDDNVRKLVEGEYTTWAARRIDDLGAEKCLHTIDENWVIRENNLVDPGDAPVRPASDAAVAIRTAYEKDRDEWKFRHEQYQKAQKNHEDDVAADKKGKEVQRKGMTQAQIDATIGYELAKTLWQAIKDQYGGQHDTTVEAREREYKDHKMTYGEKMDSYLLACRKLVANLASVEKIISERDQCRHVIKGLDARYATLAASLIAKVNEYQTVVTLEQELKEAETVYIGALANNGGNAALLGGNPANGNRLDRNGGRGGHRGRGGHFGGRGGNRNGQGGQAGHGNMRPRRQEQEGECQICKSSHVGRFCIQCYKCGGLGHMAKNCPAARRNRIGNQANGDGQNGNRIGGPLMGNAVGYVAVNDGPAFGDIAPVANGNR